MVLVGTEGEVAVLSVAGNGIPSFASSKTVSVTLTNVPGGLAISLQPGS